MVYEKYEDKYLRGLRQHGGNQDAAEEKHQMMEEDMLPQNLQYKGRRDEEQEQTNSFFRNLVSDPPEPVIWALV